ncbi:MAG: hypothetical protein R3Y05_02715 [bacterium]
MSVLSNNELIKKFDLEFEDILEREKINEVLKDINLNINNNIFKFKVIIEEEPRDILILLLETPNKEYVLNNLNKFNLAKYKEHYIVKIKNTKQDLNVIQEINTQARSWAKRAIKLFDKEENL